MPFMSDSFKGHDAAYRTPSQQSNVNRREQENSRYRDQATRSPLNTPEQGRKNMQPPKAPEGSMHSAVNTNQMGSVAKSVKGAMSRIRLMKRRSMR